MSKMIQVRSVPERLHRELVRRAKARGMALTDYIEEILEREIARPPAPEVFERISTRARVKTTGRVADVIRRARASPEAS